MFGGLIKKLFGGSGGNADEGDDKPLGAAVEHKDCTIQPIAMRKGGQLLTAGIITKTFPDGPRTHRFIRADTHGSADQANEFAIIKGRQIIDEQGDRLFAEPPPEAATP